jgi:hypothetical protein
MSLADGGVSVLSSKSLEFVPFLLIPTMLGSFVAAGYYEDRKHTFSGVPANHFPVNENGRLFYVHRGGPPIDQRMQFPMTAEQYQLWEENERSGSTWAACAVLCLFTLVGIIAWTKATESGSESSS